MLINKVRQKDPIIVIAVNIGRPLLLVSTFMHMPVMIVRWHMLMLLCVRALAIWLLLLSGLLTCGVRLLDNLALAFGAVVAREQPPLQAAGMCVYICMCECIACLKE
jgi:hypothetical protein